MAFRTAVAGRELIVLAALLACFIPAVAPAESETRGVIILGSGGDENPFNLAAKTGAQLATAETGIGFDFIDPYALNWPRESWGERVGAFAAAGREPVIAMGFAFAEAVHSASVAHPEHAFAAIDVPLEAGNTNILSLQFRAEQGAFLVGAVAALMSEAGRIGFVGGVQTPIIDGFLCGFAQGARHLRPGIEVDFGYIAPDDHGFDMPDAARRLTETILRSGADVVFHASGRSGMGVIEAVADAGRYAIGVDVDQHDLAPGHVLTSMVKRVDIAILYAADRFASGDRGGALRLGLQDRGVDWVYDERNWDLIPQAVFDRVEALKQKIILGDIVVSEGPLGATGCVL